MIVLDTHVWIWHVQGYERLTPGAAEIIAQNEDSGLGISAFSIWEIAKAVEKGKLELPIAVEEWLDHALAYPGITILPITSRIAVQSTSLPGTFHKDPADQVIVATAIVYDCPLITFDEAILAYPHVKLLP